MFYDYSNLTIRYLIIQIKSIYLYNSKGLYHRVINDSTWNCDMIIKLKSTNYIEWNWHGINLYTIIDKRSFL